MSAAPLPTSPAPTMQVDREVRFGVVMYGGVSLAIYMNGVAQELLRLVRATAPDPSAPGRAWLTDDPAAPEARRLMGTEAVYRQLGQLLGRDGRAVASEIASEAPIRTRFIVDVLSGTSAGGINAIFLAKALANGQRIDALQGLWVEEGDLAKLINDAESCGETGLDPQRPPKSLLNSRRMYRKLLDAFDGMEPTTEIPDGSASPYVDQLDLFVTTTDIRGLAVPLRLADRVVYERRHRNAFHFQYDPAAVTGPANDFRAEHNSFLAFAARCTSAFPFAFEPMRLQDVEAVLKRSTDRRHRAQVGLDPERFRPFFPAYGEDATFELSGDGAALRPPDIVERPFGDGGYLDNKPFGYVTDALTRRRARVAVDRKLLYVEPAPDLITHDDPADPPNAIENTLAALSLARYETIREDLQRVLNHNRLVERVGRVLKGLEEDIRVLGLADPYWDEDWGALDLTQMIQREGAAYGGYHRLKVAALTDELTGLLTHLAGFNTDSDEFLAIRYLVRVWRDRRYTAYLREAPEKQTQNQFLLQFDLAYRIRRLAFVLKKIDDLTGPEGADVLRRLELPRPKDEAAFQTTLDRLQASLDRVLLRLVRQRAVLRTRDPAINPLVPAVAEVGLGRQDLRRLLAEPDEQARWAYAESLLDTRGGVFDALAEALEEQVREVVDDARVASHHVLRPDEATLGEDARLALRAVRHFYDQYDRYDLIAYPVLYTTQLGEEIDEIDVFRISPLDATALVDEQKTGRKKLGGTTLMNFGAFLDRGWRTNDILWGRLDGAERILSVLLPHPDDRPIRDRLIREAHLAILDEAFGPADRDAVAQLMADAFAKTGASDLTEERLLALVQRELGHPINPKLQAALRSALDKEVLLEFFGRSYEVHRAVNPKYAVQAMARGTRVVGQMLEDMAEAHRVNRKPAAWLTRLGTAFWGLVEVAVPQSLPNLLVRHWVRLVYLLGGLLFGVGLLLAQDDMQRFGLSLLLLTAGVNVAVAVLGDLMRGRRVLLRIAGTVLIAGLLGLAVLGLVYLDDFVAAVKAAWQARL